MGDPAKKIENESVSVDGLEDVFETKDSAVLGYVKTQDNPAQSPEESKDTPVLSAEEVREDTSKDLTVKEAAELFGCSEKTILRKLRSGKLAGYKVQGEKTLEWRVKGDTKDKAVTFTESKQDKAAQDTERNSVLLEELRGQVEHLEGQLQAAIYRNGYLEGKLEDREKQVLLLPDLQSKALQYEQMDDEVRSLRTELEKYRAFAKRSGWRRFWDWMLGRSVDIQQIYEKRSGES